MTRWIAASNRIAKLVVSTGASTGSSATPARIAPKIGRALRRTQRTGEGSGSKGHGLERGGERQHKIARESEHEKAAGAKEKSRDFDLGM